MSCPAQAPHNKYIVGPRLSQHYGNYTPAHRRSIAAQPAWVHRIFGLGRHLISEFLWWSSDLNNGEFSAPLLPPCYPFQGNPLAIGIMLTAEHSSRTFDSSLASGSSQAGECKSVHVPHIALLSINHSAESYVGVFSLNFVDYRFLLSGWKTSQNLPDGCGFCPTSLRRADLQLLVAILFFIFLFLF